MRQQNIDVLLIHMPWSELLWPSIGLGLLKSGLSALGVSVKILYFNLKFAKFISPGSYLKTLKHSNRYNQIGEWTFSGALFDQSERDVENYVDEILRKPSESYRRFLSPVSRGFIQALLKTRGKVEHFLSECEHEVLRNHPRIVGFSSSFQQHTASLSLAKRIKKHSPDTFIVFGGSNCEGIMGVETIRQFSFIDAVVSGEGDIVFPELVQRVLAGGSTDGLRGVYTQNGPLPRFAKAHDSNAPSVQDMDRLHCPDYDDFFEQIERVFNLPYLRVIPIETSRGCWWGEKTCCTFCGLNGINVKFRSKSSQRVLNEIAELSQKYSVRRIRIVDNILSMNYFQDLLPRLAARGLPVQLDCDVRPNLNKGQVRKLRDANFDAIRPGIESLSTSVLKLMRKGTSALRNVQLLKWCKEFGIAPQWNLLWGFPSELPEEYDRMARDIPLLTHLHPPGGVGYISLVRFSPHFECADYFGFKDVAPAPAYRHTYPLEPGAVANLAYYFIYGYRSPQDVEEYVRSVWNEYKRWIKHHESADLFYVDNGEQLFMWDERPVALGPPLTTLSGIQRLLYIECDTVQNISCLTGIRKSLTRKAASKARVEQLLQPLVEKGLMIREGDSYLSLALRVGDYVPRREVFERFQRSLQRMRMTKQHEGLMKKIRIKELLKDLEVGKEEMCKLKA